jgi:cobyrinic acid a,c-diamide synthase
MLKRETLGRIFEQYITGADLALIEGVMGLFDGYDGKTERGSTAEVAKLLEAPVVLVMDASSMARSAAAIIHGFEHFDPDLRVAGMVFNHVAGPKHFAYLREAVEQNCRTEVLGYVSRDAGLTLPERHLGLVMAQEGVLPAEWLDRLAAVIEEHISMERFLDITQEGRCRSSLSSKELVRIAAQKLRFLSNDTAPISEAPSSPPRRGPLVRVGIARDQAFCFYYQYNLDLLRSLGAELVPFSPLKDPGLPLGVQGLYLGGGYPELHAAALAANVSMRKALRAFAEKGGPIYAECGGFMALTREIVDLEGSSHPMVGLFPTRAVMGRRLRALGYVEVEMNRDSPLGRAGERARGHEFRYSQIDPLPPEVPRTYRLFKSYQGTEPADLSGEGYVYKNCLGSYVHLHFGSNGEWARRWLELCASWDR